MISLENSFLQITCQQKGAELTSIKSKKTNLEYLWQAGSQWPKHAPVLFPFVGQLNTNSYFFNNKKYIMERHGFARTMNFNVKNKTNNEIEFILSSNADTFKIFPFEFDFLVEYSLIKTTLNVVYKVVCKSDEMFFSVGAHPAFKIPLQNSEKYSDYYLEFSEAEVTQRWKLKSGLIDEPVDFFNGIKILPLTYQLFYDDALVLKNLSSKIITIKNSKTKHGLRFECKGFPYFGIWAAKDADFICLEPWHGIADSINHNGQLTNKEGIIALSKNGMFECSYSIIPF